MKIPLEKEERRQQREPVARVWDRVVRAGHWLLVLAFAVVYLRYRKFPLHTYAGYLILLILAVRIVWGFVGSAPARFSAFLYGPRTILEYARQAVAGHAPYYASHNPMGAAMVFTLLTLLAVCGVLGLMLYSAGQQLGPFGRLVPPAWEDSLIAVHVVLGHAAAGAVAIHIAGTMWAAWLHRENYVLAMFSGRKRVPRHAGAGTPLPAAAAVSLRWQALERWFNHRYPFIGSVMLAAVVLAVTYPLILALTELNRHLYAY